MGRDVTCACADKRGRGVIAWIMSQLVKCASSLAASLRLLIFAVSFAFTVFLFSPSFEANPQLIEFYTRPMSCKFGLKSATCLTAVPAKRKCCRRRLDKLGHACLVRILVMLCCLGPGGEKGYRVSHGNGR
jgi:hypothetical protein